MGICSAAAPAAGFSIYGPTEDVAEAARWTSGLADGIRVSVDGSFLTAWSMTTTDPAVVEGWVRTAFDAWENPALQFEIHFGELDAAEITLRALPGPDPLGGLYGLANPSWEFAADRMLTNGQIVPGFSINDARIDIAAERLQSVPGFVDLPVAIRDGIATRLLMHEIGHTIGLGHTNFPLNIYYDTDLDPENEMRIDPSAPFAGLVESPNRFLGTVMSTRPCGEQLVLCFALYSTFLSWDDAGGRDVLYPALVPEPTLGVLLTVAALLVFRAGVRS